MNEKNSIPKIRPNGPGSLVIETPAGKKQTYQLNTRRTMYLHVQELQACHEMGLVCNGLACKGGCVFSAGNAKFGLPREPSLYVRGHATLEGGSISVMGAPDTQSREFSIGFASLDDEVMQQRQAAVLRQGTTARYTHVTLGYVRHQPSVGNDWFVECELVPDMLHAMSRAVSSGTLRAVTVELALSQVYLDDWAQPFAPTDWFLRPNLKDSGVVASQMAHGDIAGLSFDWASVDPHCPIDEYLERNEFQDTSPEMRTVRPDHRTAAW